MYRKITSQLLFPVPGVFLLIAQCVGVIQVAFWFLLDIVDLYVVVDLEKVSSGSSYVTVLNWISKIDFYLCNKYSYNKRVPDTLLSTLQI